LKKAKLILRRESTDPFAARISRHLLFNALNALVVLCRKDPEAAAGLAAEIGAYLRTGLKAKGRLIELDEELEHVLAYLNIQRTRFPDRLNIILEIEEGTGCLIPPFTLQAVVDNAVRHGALAGRQGGMVSLSVQKRSGTVQIMVKDDGPGMTDEQIARLLQAKGLPGWEIYSSCSAGTTAVKEIPC
jgi:two-component system sensor histidine kinase LytS